MENSGPTGSARGARTTSSIFRVLEVARWGLARLDMRFVDGDTYFPQSIAVIIPCYVVILKKYMIRLRCVL